jgi:hypothetical protein
MIRNESGFVNHETKRIFLESGFVTTIRNESMDSRNESTFLRISYMNPASLLFAQKMTFFKKIFGTSPDFHKSAGKFFLNPYPTP